MATLSGETAKASAFPISRFLLSKVDFPTQSPPVPYKPWPRCKIGPLCFEALEIGIGRPGNP